MSFYLLDVKTGPPSLTSSATLLLLILIAELKKPKTKELVRNYDSPLKSSHYCIITLYLPPFLPWLPLKVEFNLLPFI